MENKSGGIINRDIIVVGLQPWDTSIGSNCKDVALEFSKQNRVLYVNYPLDRITLFRNRNDPKVQEWERLMWTFQQSPPFAKPGEKWVLMDKIFAL